MPEGQVGGQRRPSGEVREARGRDWFPSGKSSHIPCSTDGETELPVVSHLISCDDPTRSQHRICFTFQKDASQRRAASTREAGTANGVTL